MTTVGTLAVAHRKIERMILGITLRVTKSNTGIQQQTGVMDIIEALKKGKQQVEY